jgi:hypothetical protein
LAIFQLAFDEDYAGNPLHVLVLLVVLVVACFFSSANIRGYALCLCGSVFLFWIVLKWQPWITRLHLPLLVLFAPLFGVVAERWKGWAWGLLVVLVPLGVAASVLNFTRPVIGKFSVFTAPRFPLMCVKKQLVGMRLDVEYPAAARIILDSACRDVGLVTSADSWEYPLWSLMSAQGVRLRAVNVRNATAGLENPSPPCAVIVLDRADRSGHLKASGRDFALAWSSSNVEIFLPQDPDRLATSESSGNRSEKL